MAEKKKDIKFRPGKKVSEFNPVPAMFAVKNLKHYHILVGEDFPQQRLAEQIVGVPCRFVDTLTDADLQVDAETKLFRVLSARTVILSPQVNDNTSFWSLEPIEKGSAGANAIVRYAASVLDMEKPDKDLVERLADLLATSGTIEDIRVALWTAVWYLTGPPPPETKRWAQPWEDKYLWFNIPGVSPDYRLNSLYLDMTAYTLVIGDEEYTLKKAGLRISPSKVKFFKKLKLDYSKVHDTISLLDIWRTQRTDPYICAFRISNLWKPS